MKTINLNTGQNIRFTLFPDNQPHVTVEGIEAGDEVRVICAITDSVKLIQLLETANALKHLEAVKKTAVSFICVGTPSTPSGHLNLDYIFNSAKSLNRFLIHHVATKGINRISWVNNDASLL